MVALVRIGVARPALAWPAVPPATRFLLAPVFVGLGVWLWFALPWEPSGPAYGVLAAAFVLLAGVRLRWPEGAGLVAGAGACLAAGVLAAGLRAQVVAAPMLAAPYAGPVQGRLVEIDRSQSDALRITLDRVILSGIPPPQTPHRVRVSLQGDGHPALPEPGSTLMLTARLAAPEGPAEPGGFDFRRMAWFDGLGGVGYTRTPVLLVEGPQGAALAVARARMALSAGIRAAIPGDPGAFAAGAMTGDRSGLSREATIALRDSSLTHLLAISGMNMAFLVGFVFVLIRAGLALVPAVALRVSGKKIAALVSIGVAGFYLALSGANVATERAFVMVLVMLVAVLTDRRALTLRSVAIAGLVLLLWKPESLMEAGFQMSFAATVALIAAFRGVEARVWRRRLPRIALPVFTLVLSSVVAGLATAPYVAVSFNRFTDFGLIANLLTVWAMGAVVMPAGALAALLAPFGLAAPALWALGLGSWWILHIAALVAGWEGAVRPIPQPPGWVLPVLTLGALWLAIWPGRARWAGLLAVLAAVALWPTGSRPDLMISRDGRLLGLMGPEGRALSAARGGGFAARSWLENDGDLATQGEAAKRPGFDGPREARRFVIAGRPGVALSGEGALAALPEACAAGGLVVLAARARAAPPGCLLIDLAVLEATGPLALRATPAGLIAQATQDRHRRWTSGPAFPEPLPVEGLFARVQ